MAFKCIDRLEENPVEVFLQVTDLFLKLIGNVLIYPSDPKYRKLRLENKLVSSVIIPSIGALECLLEIGFQKGDDALVLPSDKISMEKLTLFRKEILDRRNKYVKSASSATGSKVDQDQANKNICSSSKLPEVNPRLRPTVNTVNASSFAFKQLQPLSAMVLEYERKATKDKVASVVPLESISQKVQHRMREFQAQALKSGQLIDEASLQETIFFSELMEWFKNDFFEWVDSPKCDKCKGATKLLEIKSAQNENLIDTVEVYHCGNCSVQVLFPRINSPIKLLSTRKGRCGEWANAFSAICRALGWDVRYIYDDSDHAWTEVYFRSERRWVHCDPSECALDKPLLYEKGWGKKLSYIMAFSCDQVQDVTWRYSANHKDVLARRNKCSENQLAQAISELNRLRQANLTVKRRKLLARQTVEELIRLMEPAVEQDGDGEGRKSGSLSWRLARQETSIVKQEIPFVWTPTSQEITAKKMVISYCCATDEYRRLGNGNIKHWRAGVFFSNSIFRKEEKDWKMAYLCRTEGSSEGRLEWLVDLAETGMVVDQVELRCPSTTFHSGKVSWVLCTDGKCVRVEQGKLSSSEFKGSTSLTLSALLTGGDGTLAWQHTQIFRQKLDDSEPMFYFCITLSRLS